MSVLYKENGYFEDLKKKFKGGDDGDFLFKHSRVNNSPYIIVSGKNHRELVREGLPQEEGL